ncbi:hypothetical protein K3495_g630 [Podosphaera aphanis]|nr:hypothetical protein K3495_g630 [Podosphaera aphanis]
MSFHHPHDDSDSDDERITGLQTQIDELRAQLVPTDAAATGVVIEKDPAPGEGLRFRPTELPEYNGKRENYPAWRSAVLLIFKMDWNAFNYTNPRAFLAIYTSLKGDAQTKAGAFFEAGGVDGTQRPEDFLEFLDRANLDSTRVDKAADQLYGLRMGDSQRWASFYPTWASKLTEAEGDLWNDRTKITMLKNALNDRLRHSLRSNHLLPRANFLEWVRIVARIAQQVEEDDSRRQRGHQEERRNNGLRFSLSNDRRLDYADQIQSTTPQAVTGSTDGAGDIVMGGVNTALVKRNQDGEETRRSRWKTPEEIARLRRERRCYRCERKGCNTRTCPLLPAVNPNTGKVRANPVALPPIDPTTYEDIDEPEN